MESKFEKNILDRIENQELVDRIFSCKSLSDMEYSVLFLIYCGFSQKWIADHFELSQQRINQIWKSAKKKILEDIRSEEIFTNKTI